MKIQRKPNNRILSSLALLLLPYSSLPVANSWVPFLAVVGRQPTTLAASRRDISSRRTFLDIMVVTGAATVSAAAPANAFDRQEDKFSYSINIPSTMKQSQKPVKTHQDEINFASEDVKGYQYGITVDPVRINSLKEVRPWNKQQRIPGFRHIVLSSQLFISSFISTLSCFYLNR
jgi:hypothetical protein